MNNATMRRAGRREWVGLAVLMLPAMLISMDLTVLHLALPALSAELRPGSAQLLWIVDIYGFLIAGSLITMGTLGDRIGRRRLLLIGATAFAAASILAAFSTTPEMLIVTRAILGVAGATLMPSTMSLLRNMFLDQRQRTVAIGVWISSFSVGSAIGPMVGGLLLEHFWWGSVFLLAVPVMALLLAVGPVILPEFRDPAAGRLDLLSAAMSLAGVLLVIYGVKHGAESGLDGVSVVAVLAGVLVGWLFVRRQRQLQDPLIDLRLLRNRAFSASLATNTIGIFAVFGVYLFSSQYLQLVLGLSPFEAGLWTLPGAITSIVGSMLAPLFVRWCRPGILVAAGMCMVALGVGLMSQVGMDSLLLVAVANGLMMAGFGMAMTLTSDIIIAAAPPERAGAASAISETGAELGGALGIAVLGSIGVAVYRRQVAEAVPTGVGAEAAAIARDTLGGAVGVAGQLSDQLGPALLMASRQAFIEGFHLVAMCGAVMTLGLAVMALLWLGRLRADDGTGPSGGTDVEALPVRQPASVAVACR